MNSSIPLESLKSGPPIGWYQGCAIAGTIEFLDGHFFYDRLAQKLPDGSFPLGQFNAGEVLLAPGLIYKPSIQLESHATFLSLIGKDMEAETVQVPTNSESPRVMQQAIIKLIGFYAFHWWRIATLRADFAAMSDRKENVVVFAVLYFLLGFARWFGLSDRPFTGVLISLLIVAAIILVVTVRPKQSFSLAAAFLAASAAVDLIAVFIALLAIAQPGNLVYVFSEALIYIAALRAFHHAPDSVRKRGYKSSK